MNKMVLTVAGFSILLKFEETNLLERKDILYELLLQRYHKFVVVKNLRKIDYTISFISVQTFRSLTSPEGNHIFINLYDQTSVRSLTTFYHISLFQFDSILTHVIQDLLKDADGFIIHTSASIIRGRVWCFMGKSGMGKSTIVRLLSGSYKPFSDDSGVIRKQQGVYYFYQMPLLGKNENIEVSSDVVPLGGICFLSQSIQFSRIQIDDKEAIADKLFAQIYSEKKDIKKQSISVMKFINDFNNFYELSFAKNEKKVIELFA